MLVHLALVEDRGFFGIKPAGDISSRHIKDSPVQFPWILKHRDRMHVHDAIERFVGLLHLDPVHHGTKIVAEV